MKTGNDLVAEQVRYSTCLCCLPNCANQRNFAVLQRIDVCLLYSSIGRIDSFLSLHGISLYGCRPPASGAYQRRRQRAIVDSQTPRENRRNEPHPLITAPGETPAKVRVRSELPTARKDAARTEQQQDERLFEGACRHLQYRQDVDDARCPAYVRLFGG